MVHSAAFTQPWHVGLVNDPVRRQVNIFGWQRDVIEPLNGFYEIIPAETGPSHELPRSILNWNIMIDDAWIYPHVVHRLETPLTVRAPLPTISPWIGAILGALGFIMGLIALILVLRQ